MIFFYAALSLAVSNITLLPYEIILLPLGHPPLSHEVALFFGLHDCIGAERRVSIIASYSTSAKVFAYVLRVHTQNSVRPRVRAPVWLLAGIN